MNKGKVDVLLSLYNPDESYLEKQLKSLDNQTFQKRYSFYPGTEIALKFAEAKKP